MRLSPRYPVETERLRLRPLRRDDADALAAYRSLPEVCRYVPFEPMDRPAVLERIAGIWAITELTEPGQALTLGIEVAATGELIGDVILFFRSAEHQGGEIGWIIDPAHGGHGYATEAAAAMLELAFEKLGLRRVIARIDARNTASQKLARRLGMRQEAYLVQNELFKGEWSDETDFAILRSEWDARATHISSRL